MSTLESTVPCSIPSVLQTKPDGTERAIPTRLLTNICKQPKYAHLAPELERLPELITIVFTHRDLVAGRKRIVQVKNTAIAVDLTDFNKVLSGCKYFLVKDDDPESFALETDIADATITERKISRGAEIASIYTLEKNGSTYTLKVRHCVMYAAVKRIADDAAPIPEPTSTSMTTTHGEKPAGKRRRPTAPASASQQTSSGLAEIPPAPLHLLPPLCTTTAHDVPGGTLPTLASVLRFIGEKPGRPDLPFSSTVPPITPTLTTPTITVTPVTTPIPESLRRVLNP